jgi:hypothetical protein
MRYRATFDRVADDPTAPRRPWSIDVVVAHDDVVEGGVF